MLEFINNFLEFSKASIFFKANILLIGFEIIILKLMAENYLDRIEWHKKNSEEMII